MRALRFVARAATIAFFLLWHGLRWGLVWIGMALAARGRAERRDWFGACLLALFRDLGATFIKVGQIMSTRPDLLPPHVIRALEKLQDQVGPFEYTHVQRTILEDFGGLPEQLFEEFSKEPVASASVAQVHRARLADGRLVAVKVRRPRIEQIVVFDLAVMRFVARAMSLIPSIRLLSPTGAVEEFGHAIHMQLDFEREAQHSERFRRMFTGDADVVFPALVFDLCSRRVLTMEFIEGTKILHFRRTAHDPARLARVGFRVLFRMVFEEGFVHADLHPGNIFVTPEGKVAILDMGLVGVLDDVHRLAFARFFAAWAAGDGKTVARIMIELPPTSGAVADPETLEREVSEFVERTRRLKVGEIQVGLVILDMMGIFRRHRVRVNAHFTMVSIAMAVTEGIGKQLDPTLDLMHEALPYFARIPFDGPSTDRARA